MKLKKKIGLFIFVFSFVFLALGINLTGNVVGDYFQNTFAFIHILGIFTFIFGLFIFLYEDKNLDYLLVPTGWEKQRKQRALEEITKRDIKNILILNGNDSEEDILYLGKRLKGKERIGFVTFPLHYQEYKEIIKKAQEEGKFPKRIKTENVATEQTLKQFIYGILGLLEERLDKKVNYTREERKNYFIEKIKYAVRNLLK